MNQISSSSDCDREFHVFASNSNSECMRDVTLNGCKVRVLIDTGAECNVVPRHAVENVALQPTQVKISAWGNFPIHVLGTTQLKVAYKDTCVSDEFYVVETPHSNEMKTLISYQLSRKLGIMKELAQVSTEGHSTVPDPVRKFEHVFNRPGFLTTGYEYTK